MTVWRVRDRATFDDLRRGRRSRRGPVSVQHAPSPAGTPPRVAFALPRSVGSAVTRNRLRRRLREVCRDLERAGHLGPGAYLVSARADALDLPYAALRDEVAAAVAEICP